MLKLISFFLFLLTASVWGHRKASGFTAPESFKNIWAPLPQHIPNNVSIDASLMGNGDVTIRVEYQENDLSLVLLPRS